MTPAVAAISESVFNPLLSIVSRGFFLLRLIRESREFRGKTIGLSTIKRTARRGSVARATNLGLLEATILGTVSANRINDPEKTTTSTTTAMVLLKEKRDAKSTASEAPISENKKTAIAFETNMVDNNSCGDLNRREETPPCRVSRELVRE
jgi:hypothetical protein